MIALGPEDFLQFPLPQALGSDEIHLWFFPQWEHSVRAVAESRGVRALLAGYLNCAEDEVKMARDTHGKPHLVDAPLEFNLSHSGGALLIGLSHEQALGVDLEMHGRTRPALDLARRYFDPAEAAALGGLPAARQHSAFLRLWSCKEATLKAQGRGIGFGLHRVTFGLDSADAISGMQSFDGEPAIASWCIRPLCPAENATGALVWHGPERTVRAFRSDLLPG